MNGYADETVFKALLRIVVDYIPAAYIQFRIIRILFHNNESTEIVMQIPTLMVFKHLVILL